MHMQHIATLSTALSFSETGDLLFISNLSLGNVIGELLEINKTILEIRETLLEISKPYYKSAKPYYKSATC